MRTKKNGHDGPAGIQLPVPAPIVSSGERPPAPQTPEQGKAGLLKEWPAQRSRVPGLSRREFLAGSGGMAMALTAMNEVFGFSFPVRAAAQPCDLEAYPELWPRTSFIFDAQARRAPIPAPISSERA